MQNIRDISYGDRLGSQARSNRMLAVAVLGALFVLLIGMRMLPEESTPLLGKVMVLLGPTLATASAGAYFGRRLTGWLPIIGLFAVSMIGLFIIRAAGGSDVALPLLLGWGFVNGMILGPLIGMVLVQEGPEIVVQALVGTTTIMMGTGFVALATGINFSFLMPVLFLALFGLIVVGLIGIFVRFSRTINLAYSILGIIVFSGYFLFDFFHLSKSENTWQQAVQLTTRLYLDFANLFIFVLNLLLASRRR
ncbi:MAG TPA: Bax inhibitor-1 family protein [Blastocatellia bacterium]|nr:Bax inhibitor-1 family protein [Blastocatellia bacterium]